MHIAPFPMKIYIHMEKICYYLCQTLETLPFAGGNKWKVVIGTCVTINSDKTWTLLHGDKVDILTTGSNFVNWD